MKIILASSSPRRAEILREAGIPFEIRATHIDETPLPGEAAQGMVARLAEAKTRAAAAEIGAVLRDCIIVGADTAVELAAKSSESRVIPRTRAKCSPGLARALTMSIQESSFCDCPATPRARQSKIQP